MAAAGVPHSMVDLLAAAEAWEGRLVQVRWGGGTCGAGTCVCVCAREGGGLSLALSRPLAARAHAPPVPATPPPQAGAAQARELSGRARGALHTLRAFSKHRMEALRWVGGWVHGGPMRGG